MNIDEEIKIFKKNRLLETDEEITYFEESIKNILPMENITNIKYLLLGFDDNTKNFKDKVDLFLKLLEQ